jgi:hypothetical protein
MFIQQVLIFFFITVTLAACAGTARDWWRGDPSRTIVTSAVVDNAG